MTQPAHVPDTHAAVPQERSIKLLWDTLQMYQVLYCTQLCTCGQKINVLFKLEDTPKLGFRGGEPELSEQWQSAVEHLNITFIQHMNGVPNDGQAAEVL